MSDQNIIGTLEQNEKLILEGLKSSARDLTYELGQMELRKVHIIRRIGEAEQKAQQVLEEVGKRLEIPENAIWQVIDDKVMYAPQHNQSAPPPVAEEVD